MVATSKGPIRATSFVVAASVFAVCFLMLSASALAVSFSEIDSGPGSCAISNDGALYCWPPDSALAQEDDGTVGPFENEEYRPRKIYLVPGTVTDVSYGERSLMHVPGGHSCAVSSGAAFCWGRTGAGQLGTGVPSDPFDLEPPAQVAGLATGVTDISAGQDHTCAVVGGAAKCWGYGGSGRLGNGSSSDAGEPVQVSGLTSGVTHVSAGGSSSCAVVNGGVKCWGYGWYGALGNGTSGMSANSDVPVDTTIGSGATKVDSAGPFGKTCAIVSGGVKCWGANTATPTDVPTLASGVTDLAVGADHSCAVQSGTVKCWGANEDGQLGNGLFNSSAAPVAVTGSGATSVSVGDKFSCAIFGGVLKCWGVGGPHLGAPTPDNTVVTEPVTVLGGEGGATASSITLPGGYEHGGFGCFLVTGMANCWGTRPGYSGNAYSTGIPTGLSGGVSVISAGGGVSDVDDHGFLCAVVAGAAKCLGNNTGGQLGNNSTTSSTAAVQVEGLTSDVTDISAGGGLVEGFTGFHACAVVAGSAKCWGENHSGELGNGATTRSLVPVQVTGLTSGVTDISAGRNNDFSPGDNHTCAVHSGAVKCWGMNGSGQLGDGSQTTRNEAVQVTGLASGATQVAAGDHYSCAVVSGGAKCWGEGPLGSSNTTSLTAIDVSGATSGVTSIATGFTHACAVVGGAAKCWGANDFGQLGNSSTTDSNTPVQVTGLTSGVTAIAAGTRSSCAIQNDQVKCWGWGGDARLGDGVKRGSWSPNPIAVLDAIDVPPPGPGNPPGGGSGGGSGGGTTQPPPIPAIKPSIKSTSKSAKYSSGIALKVSCASSCTISGTVVVGKKKLKLKTIAVPGGAVDQSVKVKLPASVKKKVKLALKNKKKVKLNLSLVSGAGTVTTSVSLK